MTLSATMDIISDRLRTVEGVATSTSNPEEQMSPDDFPAIAVFLGRGTARAFTADNGEGFPTILVPSTIVVDLHFDRREDPIGTSLFKASRMLIPILKEIFKLYIGRFNNNVVAMGDPSTINKYPITYEFLHLNWGSIETLGYRIRIDVASEEALR